MTLRNRTSSLRPKGSTWAARTANVSSSKSRDVTQSLQPTPLSLLRKERCDRGHSISHYLRRLSRDGGHAVRRLKTALSLLTLPFCGPDGVIQLNFRPHSGLKTRKMARFVKQVALVSAVATVAFAGPALATDARYTCSHGSKLTAQFSPQTRPRAASR
jgi:hypothetical protein